MTEANAAVRSALYAEEAFVVDVQSFLQELMEEKGLTRSQLAEAMGVSRARISQIFSDECKNFTVRLLAKAVHALGETPQVECQLTRQIADRKTRLSQRETIDSDRDVIAMWSGPYRWRPEPDGVDSTGTRLAGVMGEHLRSQGRHRHLRTQARHRVAA
jgi:transcriptional regulator with XRE-family HTH domain